MTIAIIGGGIAGAAAACLLGPLSTLIEREPAPHDKVCGEFISWEANDALARLGIDIAALGAAPIDAVRLVHGRRVVRAPLPGPGHGLSRRVLDEALLVHAARAGATILRGRTVRRLLPEAVDVDGALLPAARILLATGKHDLRGARRDARPENLVGLKTYYRLAADQAEALAGHVEIILFPGGYAGLQPVDGNRANLCLLIQRRAFDEAGATWPGVLAHLTRTAPHLATRLHAADPLLGRPLAIFRVPYGFVHRAAPQDPPGLARLGDQMAVIPSFSGDGMAIALHTAQAAATAPDPATYHRRMKADLGGQIARAMLLHRAGQLIPATMTAAAQAWPAALSLIAKLTRAPSPPAPRTG